MPIYHAMHTLVIQYIQVHTVRVHVRLRCYARSSRRPLGTRSSSLAPLPRRSMEEVEGDQSRSRHRLTGKREPDSTEKAYPPKISTAKNPTKTTTKTAKTTKTQKTTSPSLNPIPPPPQSSAAPEVSSLAMRFLQSNRRVTFLMKSRVYMWACSSLPSRTSRVACVLPPPRVWGCIASPPYGPSRKSAIPP